MTFKSCSGRHQKPYDGRHRRSYNGRHWKPYDGRHWKPYNGRHRRSYSGRYVSIAWGGFRIPILLITFDINLLEMADCQFFKSNYTKVWYDNLSACGGFIIPIFIRFDSFDQLSYNLLRLLQTDSAGKLKPWKVWKLVTRGPEQRRAQAAGIEGSELR